MSEHENPATNFRSELHFLLGAEQISLNLNTGEFRPTTTVLEWLRATGNTGTKEGCAEGDCGACTVVIGKLDNTTGSGDIIYQAIDSCLVFLPMIDGAQLITVEQLRNPTELHPVQKAMVDHDASQCGFCTPGIIMSLFGLYREALAGIKFDQNQIQDALSGNLCRCTGYKSIMAAAVEALSDPEPDLFDTEMAKQREALSSLSTNSLLIARSDQLYCRPSTLKMALEIYSETPSMLPFTGATDIALRVTKNHEILPALLDLGGIKSLHYITQDHKSVRIGASVSLERVRLLVADSHPELASIIGVFGSKQIRELASLGGNIGSASPIGDTIPVLMAYDAEVELRALSGTRRVPLKEFITGYRKTDRQAGELITAVHLPALTDKVKVIALKASKRRDLDIATASLAIRLMLKQETVHSLSLFYGGMAEMPKQAFKTQEALIGKDWNLENIKEVQPLLREDFTPITDARSEAESRAILAANLLELAWHRSTEKKRKKHE
ncbi:MAG: xanthine dehydrogenase small subunit [Limisphaerales bacterium]|jgi:xanthine dehydrogenase small subunit